MLSWWWMYIRKMLLLFSSSLQYLQVFHSLSLSRQIPFLPVSFPFRPGRLEVTARRSVVLFVGLVTTRISTTLCFPSGFYFFKFNLYIAEIDWKASLFEMCTSPMSRINLTFVWYMPCVPCSGLVCSRQEMGTCMSGCCNISTTTR